MLPMTTERDMYRLNGVNWFLDKSMSNESKEVWVHKGAEIGRIVIETDGIEWVQGHYGVISEAIEILLDY